VETAPALGPRATLKWPNDLLIDGAKVAGILVEGESAGSTLAAVVGIGVNCASHPDDTPYPATNLAAAGAAVSADDLMSALARTMTARLAQWDRGGGFASVRADWLKRTGGIGRDLRIVVGGREIVGRFETLDVAGRLILRLPNGIIEAVAAGDVFPVTRANAPAGT
jgi:BirA family biotin operon repressor/biotin-[acetyl-CoA-carboxylase] ligase